MESLGFSVSLVLLLREVVEAIMAELQVFCSDELTFTETTIQAELAVTGEEACVGNLVTQMNQIMHLYAIQDKVSKEE